MSAQVILIVEDDAVIREGVRILLGAEGYTVLEAASGEAALERFDHTVDLVILDILLPGISGLQVCEQLRRTSNVPVLFLTAKGQDSDKALGLMAGGDDYLVKPFSSRELLARVKAQLRRYCIYRGKEQEGGCVRDQVLTSGRLQVALDRNEVYKDGQLLNLTDIEYGILALLISHPQETFSAQMIYERVWKEAYTYSTSGTIMVHIRKLRTKIEDDPQNPVYIRNVWGRGYRYEAKKVRR